LHVDLYEIHPGKAMSANQRIAALDGHPHLLSMGRVPGANSMVAVVDERSVQQCMPFG
jgi:hypothetical protein